MSRALPWRGVVTRGLDRLLGQGRVRAAAVGLTWYFAVSAGCVAVAGTLLYVLAPQAGDRAFFGAVLALLLALTMAALRFYARDLVLLPLQAALALLSAATGSSALTLLSLAALALTLRRARLRVALPVMLGAAQLAAGLLIQSRGQGIGGALTVLLALTPVARSLGARLRLPPRAAGFAARLRTLAPVSPWAPHLVTAFVFALTLVRLGG